MLANLSIQTLTHSGMTFMRLTVYHSSCRIFLFTNFWRMSSLISMISALICPGRFISGNHWTGDSLHTKAFCDFKNNYHLPEIEVWYFARPGRSLIYIPTTICLLPSHVLVVAVTSCNVMSSYASISPLAIYSRLKKNTYFHKYRAYFCGEL